MMAFYLHSGFGIYGEIITVEASALFAAYTQDLSQTSVYADLINIIYFIGFFGIEFCNTLRTHCNIEKGKHSIEGMTHIIKMYTRPQLLPH